MMQLRSVVGVVIGLNWKNAIFRLWIILSVCWEALIIYRLWDEGVHGSTLFASILPVLGLIIFVLAIKLGKWVVFGLHDRGNGTDTFIQKIVNAVTMQNIIKFADKIRIHSKPRQTYIIFAVVFVSILAIAAVSFYPDRKVTYVVEAPDGKILTLQGPAGISEEKILAQAKKIYRPFSNSAVATNANAWGVLRPVTDRDTLKKLNASDLSVTQIQSGISSTHDLSGYTDEQLREIAGIPPPPPGFKIDQPSPTAAASQLPPLPPGFVLDPVRENKSSPEFLKNTHLLRSEELREDKEPIFNEAQEPKPE